MADALERLFAADNTDNPNYSIDEQMASISEDDFLDSMSKDSRDALMSSVQPTITEVTLEDDNIMEEKVEEKENEVVYSELPKNEALFNNNGEDIKKNSPPNKKGRPPKQTNESAVINKSSNSFDPIMNQLALNLLRELQNKKFKLDNFDDNLMQILFDYMRTKF